MNPLDMIPFDTLIQESVGEAKTVAPSFLLACVLWQDVKAGWEQRLARGEHAFPALQDAIDEVFDKRIGDVSGRGKLATGYLLLSTVAGLAAAVFGAWLAMLQG